MSNCKIGMINTTDFDKVVKKLRSFFDGKGFQEVHTQSRLSILAACEDPKTISTYSYAGQVWPLPQTGQMWLEYELLSKPESKGFYCVSTSYRNEPNPVEGRHDKIFPMFEFEMKGNMDEMKKLEEENYIELERSSRVTRLYPAGIPKDEAEICKYLNMSTQKKILLFILEKKIVTSIQIRDHIKKSPSVVSVNLNELFKAKIINRKYDIPSNKFSLKKPQLLKAVLNEYYPDLTEKYWLRSSVSA